MLLIPTETTRRGQSGSGILLPEPKKRKVPKLDVLPSSLRRGSPKANTLADYLASQGGDGTDLERIIRNAARMLNFHFDAEQYIQHLNINGSYTVIDFVTFNPKRAVYPQGWQHYVRLDSYQKDTLQDMELRSNGWAVFRPSYLQIYRDPLLVMRKIILMIEEPTRRDP